MNIFNVVILMSKSEEGGLGMMPFILLMMVVMYFFIFLPQIRKQKKQKSFSQNLKKGDNIVTSSGIHGKVTSINDSTLLIETEGQGKLKIEKSAVSLEVTATVYGPKDEKGRK